MMIDFSEHYNAKCSSEIQSMHFGASRKQIALHTVVCYLNDGEKIIPKSFCTVSDNLAHQSFAVWAHLDSGLESLSKEFPQTEVVHLFQTPFLPSTGTDQTYSCLRNFLLITLHY